MKRHFEAESFDSYEQASLRTSTNSNINNNPTNLRPVSLYTWKAWANMLPCMLRLFLELVSPYCVVPLCVGLIWVGLDSFLGIFFLVLLVALNIHFHAPKPSQVAGRSGSPIFGALSSPGLYYYKQNAISSRVTFLERILSNCPFITSPDTLSGNLTEFTLDCNGKWMRKSVKRPTPWTLSGDIRTLVPFLTNMPRDVQYIRRWIRTPVATSPEHSPDWKGDSESGSEFESVALDWSPPGRGSSECNAGDESECITAILVLSGLTGGSKEGYVLDLVNRANERGWHCFCMLARGLGNTPNMSGEPFNGARCTDLIAAAKVVRKCLPPKSKLFVAGISMGAIIASNALVNSDLGEYVDGVVAVSGCMNIHRHSHFEHSRRCWQPMLAHSLKQVFIEPVQHLPRLISEYGSREAVQRVVERVVDVYDFDCVFVTHLHRFKSVDDYYDKMCTSEMQLLDPESRGILTVRQQLHESSSASAHAAASAGDRLLSDDEDAEGSKEEDFAKKQQCQRSRASSDDFRVAAPPLLRLVRPMLVLHAVDDPISHVDSMPCVEGLSVNHCASWGSTGAGLGAGAGGGGAKKKHGIAAARQVDNLVCMVTRSGGHVGWPVGLLPWRNGFAFSSSVAMEFFTAIAAAMDDDGCDT